MCCCCEPHVAFVTANSALTDATATPVTLTLGRTLTGLGLNSCFDLCIPVGLLKNSNTGLVQITDGTTTLEAFTHCTDQLRYDSLVAYGRDVCKRGGCLVKLRCMVRATPEPGHVWVKTCLPRSSYVAPAAAGA